MNGFSLFIGEFPPPFGGVSTKNQFLLDKVYKDRNCEIINLYEYKKNPLKLFSLVSKFLTIRHVKGKIYIGVGSNRRLDIILRLIAFFGGTTSMKKVNVFVMGSTLYSYCQDNPRMIKILNMTDRLIVELWGMIKELNSIGIVSTYYLPNCRDGQYSIKPHKLQKDKPIKLLFFSTVNREKGVPYLFKMAELLKNKSVDFELDIYGVVSNSYEIEFNESLSRSQELSIYYKGVYDTVNKDVYTKISEYDILLLPTQWKAESCIGVLVESKMAGIPAIVSDFKYNSEIIVDSVEGFVVPCDKLSEGFADKIEKLSNNHELYDRLAKGSHDSRTRYDINSYVEELLHYDIL